MSKTLLTKIGAVASLVVFCMALWVLHHALQNLSVSKIVAEFNSIPAPTVLAAAGLTALSYFALTGYDALALRSIGRALPYGTVALASFAGYAFSHNIGLALLSGGSVRYRIYSTAGLSSEEISKVVVLCTMTFGLGATAVAGTALLVHPGTLAAAVHLSATTVFAAGAAVLATIAGYLALTTFWRRSFDIMGASVTLPSVGETLLQIALAAVEMTVSASVLYVLLPTGASVSLGAFVGIYILAVAAGILSHVPGGLGVFETTLLLLMPGAPSEAMLGAVLAYRLIYYIVPLGVAAALLGTFELARQRHRLRAAGSVAATWLSRLSPAVVGAAVFVAGAILLFSGATPALDDRVHLLEKFVPLFLVEVSHLLGSVAGLGLIILAHGLFRRLDAACFATGVLLIAGIVASLLKGIDYEEAIALSTVLAALVAARGAFWRKASVFQQRFTIDWLVTVAIVLAGSLWLGLFSYRQVAYSDSLWWQFAFQADAPRFLRASVAVAVLAAAVGLIKLLRPAPHRPGPPDARESERARAAIALSPASDANLALAGDKNLLFSDSGRSFIMYAVERQSWIAMGGPVGLAAEHSDLAWRFHELCSFYGGHPVFYQVDAESLGLYADLGLTFLKIGEEARVALPGFTLKSSRLRDLRHDRRRAEKEGVTLDIIEPPQVAAEFAALQAVSDAWLAGKKGGEKGFSVGRFEARYLAHFRCAVVRQAGRIVAFANLWETETREEVAVDLMRHLPDAPRGVMDFLFAELMGWGRDAGYRWFNLGMAPLSGLADHAVAPLWQKLGAFAYRHGENFYNFEGLRAYKEKFAPEWRPKYLAAPAGLGRAAAVVDLVTLISGKSAAFIRR